MKIKHIIPVLAVPFLFVACEKAKQITDEKIDATKETATEKMNAGAEKVADGVKEISAAAEADAKAAMDKVGEATKANVEAAKESVSEATVAAKEKMTEASDAAKDAGAKALEDAAKAAQEAADKLKTPE